MEKELLRMLIKVYCELGEVSLENVEEMKSVTDKLYDEMCDFLETFYPEEMEHGLKIFLNNRYPIK